VALISGSTSGIGKSVAFLFAKEGAKVVVTGRREDRGKQIAEEINKAHKGAAIYLKLDVTQEAEWQKVVDETVKTFGKLDILVNNSGSFTGGPIENTTVQQWRDVFATNVEGVFLGIKVAGEALKKNPQGGSIVNVGSVVSTGVIKGWSAYSATKAAVAHLTRIAAAEYAPFKIRINDVEPGFTVTEMFEPLVQPAIDKGATKEQAIAEFGKTVPIGYIATPEEIAKPILFLVSDDASYTTGAALIVDGGIRFK
jgi:NAD(P)-dependent dehydrogenase (short-subunit alcohol dehydrogenase family)